MKIWLQTCKRGVSVVLLLQICIYSCEAFSPYTRILGDSISFQILFVFQLQPLRVMSLIVLHPCNGVRLNSLETINNHVDLIKSESVLNEHLTTSTIESTYFPGWTENMDRLNQFEFELETINVPLSSLLKNHFQNFCKQTFQHLIKTVFPDIRPWTILHSVNGKSLYPKVSYLDKIMKIGKRRSEKRVQKIWQRPIFSKSRKSNLNMQN